jgi:hypothetical protein
MNGGEAAERLRAVTRWLIVCGLVAGFGWAGLRASSPASPGSSAVGSAASAVAAQTPAHATPSSCLDRAAAFPEEAVEAVDGEHDQAAPQAVSFARASLQATVGFGSHPAAPIRPPFVDSTRARGPPSA